MTDNAILPSAIHTQGFAIHSMRNICCANQDGSVGFNSAGKVFASCNLFNGRAILAEHIELVLMTPMEIVI